MNKEEAMIPATLASHIRQQRKAIREQPHREFVTPETFCKLALAHKKLYRCDEGKAALRGLVDPATGTHYLVKEEQLLDALESWALLNYGRRAQTSDNLLDDSSVVARSFDGS